MLFEWDCFILFSDVLLFVCRNTTDFCMLILYPATLLNLLISSSTFLVESLGFSIYKIILSSNKDNFTTFSHLDALARTSSTILSRSGENGQPCKCSTSQRKSFQPFTTEHDIGCGFVINGFHCVEESFFYTQLVECFCHERMVYYVKCFFCTIKMII